MRSRDRIEILAGHLSSYHYSATRRSAEGYRDGMSLLFDLKSSTIGALSLRRRRELSLGVDVFEIKPGD
jgi:hypothetical protein